MRAVVQRYFSALFLCSIHFGDLSVTASSHGRGGHETIHSIATGVDGKTQLSSHFADSSQILPCLAPFVDYCFYFEYAAGSHCQK